MTNEQPKNDNLDFWKGLLFAFPIAVAFWTIVIYVVVK